MASRVASSICLPRTDVGTVSLATYADNALPGRYPGQCACMQPKPSTLGVNAPYRTPRILGLFRAKALLAHALRITVQVHF